MLPKTLIRLLNKQATCFIATYPFFTKLQANKTKFPPLVRELPIFCNAKIDIYLPSLSLASCKMLSELNISSWVQKNIFYRSRSTKMTFDQLPPNWDVFHILRPSFYVSKDNLRRL